MSLEAIMSTTIISASPTATVREAIRLLEDSEIRHLPVVEEGRLLGIISDRDLREYREPLLVEIENFDSAAAERVEEALDTAIVEVMSSDVISVDSSESIASVIDAMSEYKVGAVPVIDRRTDKLAGIISYIDVLRYARTLIEPA